MTLAGLDLPNAGSLTDLHGPDKAEAGTAPSYNPAPTPYTGVENWYCANGLTPGANDKNCKVSDFWASPVIGPFSIKPIGAPTTVDLRKVVMTDALVRAWGYIGDGASHPLSGITNFGGINTTGFSLGQWQALLPSATATSNEVDGEAVRSLIAAASGPVAIVFPPGVGRFSNPIASCAQSVSLFGAGGLLGTELNFVNGTDGWDHCPSTGTNTRIEAHDIVFNSTTTTGSLFAVQAKFIASFNVKFDNAQFLGFNNGIDLTQAAGIDFNYVFVQNGNASGTTANGNGITLHGQSTFVERFENVLVQNYTIAYNFISTNSSAQGIEDVAVLNSACGGVKICFQITAPNFAGYGPYLYRFDGISADATTQFINAPQARSLYVHGGDWLVDVPVGTWTGVGSDFFSFNKASTIHLDQMSISNNALTQTINSYIHVIGTNSPTDVQISNNTFEYLNLTASAAQIVVDAAATAVVVKDNIFTSGTVATAPPGNAFSFLAVDQLSQVQGSFLKTATATGIGLVNATAKTLTSIALTQQGDYSCSGYTSFIGSGQTNGPSFLQLSLSLVNNTNGATPDISALVNIVGGTTQPNQAQSLIAHDTDFLVTSAGITVYLVAQANFANTETANNALINCRRWR